MNIIIEEAPTKSASNSAQFQAALTAAESQDDTYDLICMGIKDNLTGLVNRGLLADLNDIPYMDLSMPYYDQNSIKDLSIMNKNFFVMGDMLTMDNDATRCLSFNKKIAAEIGIETQYGKDIYTIVNDGEWTMDAMYEMSQLAARDTNGNGIMEAYVDRYGLITESFNSLAMINCAGGRLVSKDSDDIPYYSANNATAIDVLQDIIPIQKTKHVLCTMRH